MTNTDHYFDPTSPRIIGGKDAIPGRYPYLVDLDAGDGDHYCMGSLLTESLVLTAAHWYVRRCLCVCLFVFFVPATVD